jgi:hypothetical protein
LKRGEIRAWMQTGAPPASPQTAHADSVEAVIERFTGGREIPGVANTTFLRHALDHLPDADLAGWATAHTARHGLARRWSLWYQDYPLLLSPVWMLALGGLLLLHSRMEDRGAGRLPPGPPGAG